jgi:hypothetical protein
MITSQKAEHGKGGAGDLRFMERAGAGDLWFMERAGAGNLLFHGKGRRGLVLWTLFDSVSPTVTGVLDKKQALLKCTCTHWMLLVWISFRATHSQQYRKFQTRSGRYWSARVLTGCCWFESLLGRRIPNVPGVSSETGKKQALLKCTCPHWSRLGCLFFSL